MWTTKARPGFVLLVVLALLLGACANAEVEPDTTEGVVETTVGSAEPDSTTTAVPGPDTTEATTGADGGLLRVAVVEDPQTMDPHLAASGGTFVITEQVYSTLVKLDPDNVVVPDLASNWEISDDGTVYTFELRPNVTFHNGDPLTAEDVVFTFNRLLDPETGYPRVDRIEAITDVRAVDDLTVEITLEAASGPFLTSISHPGTAIVPQSEVEARGDLSSTMIGTGPFRFVDYQAGSHVTLERNEDYFLEDLPRVDGMEMLFIPNETERTSALLGGRVDFVTQASFVDYDRVVDTDGFTGSEVIGHQYHFLHLNSGVAPLDDQRVRQAISQAINRQELVDVIFEGYAQPMLGDIVPSWSWAALDEEGVSPTGDPELARSLLAEAGFPDGVDLTMVLWSDLDLLARQGPLLQAQLAAAGINLNLEQLEVTTYLDRVYGEVPDYEVTNMYHVSPLIDPDDFISNMYLCGTLGARANAYCDDQVNELINEARFMVDEDERREIYHEIQEITMEQRSAIPLVNQSILNLYSDNVQGFEPYRAGSYGSFAEVWLEG